MAITSDLSLIHIYDSQSELEVNGVFIAVGIHPNTELYQGLVEMDEQGYVCLLYTSKNPEVELVAVNAPLDAEGKYNHLVPTPTGCLLYTSRCV